MSGASCGVAVPTNSARWYAEPKDNIHRALSRVCKSVWDQNAWVRDAHEYHAALYCGAPVGTGLASWVIPDGTYRYQGASLPDNIVRSNVDSMVAKIAKQRPQPQVLADRGDWAARKRAKKCTQFLEGEFYRQRVYEVHSSVLVRDACTFGFGALKVFRQGRRVCCERVMPWELMVDEWDAKYGSPRNIYHVRSVDRGLLLELFARSASGGWKTAIRDAIEAETLGADEMETLLLSSLDTVDRVKVYEAWHLCDNEEAHEFNEEHKCTGRHVISVSGATLLDEEWEHPYFPFAILNYADPIKGFFGAGMVEQLEGAQVSINEMNERAAEMYRMSTTLIFVDERSKVLDSDVTNGIGTIVRHAAGGQPVVQSINMVNPAMEQRIQSLTARAFQNVGQSQMSAQSQKPAGISSGIALQTLDDVETERFVVFGRAYETWNLEVARRMLDIAKEVAAKYGEHSVKVKMSGGFVSLKWADVVLDGYELQVFPTSRLPKQLGARLDTLNQLFNAGIIDRDTFLRQLDAPDLSTELDMATADKMNVDERIDAMVEVDLDEETDKDPYLPPSPYIDLAWAARRAQQRLNKGETDGMPEGNQELLRRFVSDCEALIAKANPPPAGPDGQLPPPPPVGPANDLMPPPMAGAA